jgi:hypothetical protein
LTGKTAVAPPQLAALFCNRPNKTNSTPPEQGIRQIENTSRIEQNQSTDQAQAHRKITILSARTVSEN